MWPFETELRELDVKQIPWRRESAGRPVLFYGGSSIRFWDRSQYTSFEGPYLNAALGLEDAVNVGFGGAKIQDCVYLFERLVLPFRPRALLLYAGDNDLANGFSPSRVVNAYRYLVHKTRHYCGKNPFTFISIKPSPGYLANLKKISQVNAMIEEEASRQKNCYFVDVYHPMLDEQANPAPRFFEGDRVHLSAEGYRLWAEILLEKQKEFPIFGNDLR